MKSKWQKGENKRVWLRWTDWKQKNKQTQRKTHHHQNTQPFIWHQQYPNKWGNHITNPHIQSNQIQFKCVLICVMVVCWTKGWVLFSFELPTQTHATCGLLPPQHTNVVLPRDGTTSKEWSCWKAERKMIVLKGKKNNNPQLLLGLRRWCGWCE